MAKFKNPSNYHLDGILHFKNARQITWLEQQEMSRKPSKVTRRKKQKSHIDSHWEDVLHDTWS